MSGGTQRTYIIDIPANYDMSKPYRFFYTSHWISSTADAVQQQNFYFLKPLALAVLALYWLITGLIALGPGAEPAAALLRKRALQRPGRSLPPVPLSTSSSASG